MNETTKELDKAAARALDRGEVLVEAADMPGSSTPRVVARGVVEAAPRRVWAVIDDVAAYPRNMPGVKRAQVLSREGSQVRSRVTVGMPFPLKDLTATTRAEHRELEDGSFERRWTMEEGDYRTNSGAWTIAPFQGDPARSLVTYELHAEPKIPIPKKIQGLAQRKALPGIFKRLREICR